MIEREISPVIKKMAEKYPVISLTGPRQSGKTTLLKHIFPEYQYFILENPETRLLAINDPQNFIIRCGEKAIIDEIQHAPELFSYIQITVDEKKIPGQFILSGSQNFLLHEKISQSLAGRAAILKLLPLSISEIQNVGIQGKEYETLLFNGLYPGLYDLQIESRYFYPNYIETYLERDVRSIKQITNLADFIRFLQLCAARTGNLLNLSSLAQDAGISVNTAKSWISVLEASYIIFLLQPYYKNFNKRIVKMPKLYFYDVGLAVSLLRIETVSQLNTHYHIGSLFENLIITEFVKYRYNQGLQTNCYFWRDNKGEEIDCIVEKALGLVPIEIKSSKTFNYSFLNNIKFWNALTGNPPENSYIIYGSNNDYIASDVNVYSWMNLSKLIRLINS
ncbi:MAG: ATP-binding protein [Bacteroidia bacterium]|nr:ATP-binding protein [Bacteroidia bacterium]